MNSPGSKCRNCHRPISSDKENRLCSCCDELLLRKGGRSLPPVGLVVLLAVFLLVLWLLRVAINRLDQADERLYHSEVSIRLPDEGQILGTDYIAGLDPQEPKGLIVNTDDRGVVVEPVKFWGWARVSANESADINHDGYSTGADWDLFMVFFHAGDIGSDFNRDGFVTGEDFDEFARVFVGGAR